MARDYKAEYARRLAKAEREGRDRASARGHTSHATENARRSTDASRLQRQVNYWTRKTLFGQPEPWYRQQVKDTVRIVGRAETVALLKRRYSSNVQFLGKLHSGEAYGVAAKSSDGHAIYYADRPDEDLPDVLFWYRASL